MARLGASDREHSGHYLTAVGVVTVVVAVMAWFSQNRTLAAAAAALGLYSLHLLSIRFLLDNQRRQRQILDAQWEVLQRFIGDGVPIGDEADLIPAMPVDREAPETLEEVVVPVAGRAEEGEAPERNATEPDGHAAPEIAAPQTPEAKPGAVKSGPSTAGPLVPPAESMTAHTSSESAGSGIEGSHLVGTPSRPGRERPHGNAAQVPVPRHFALGTVALVRDLLTPAEVARILLEQRRQPGKKFGELAVEMRLLTESQREELLLAQQEGLFTDAEMRDARRRLREFRESAAHSMAGLE